MRDFVGSSFMVRLMLVFLVFFITFATLSVSYAKVFRIKNGVIDILEQKKFNYNSSSDVNNILYGDIDKFLDKNAYRFGDNSMVKNNCQKQNGILSNNGACVSSYYFAGKEYYKVTTYIVINIPLFSYSAIMPISGEFTNYG